MRTYRYYTRDHRVVRELKAELHVRLPQADNLIVQDNATPAIANLLLVDNLLF